MNDLTALEVAYLAALVAANIETAKDTEYQKGECVKKELLQKLQQRFIELRIGDNSICN